MNSVCVCVHVVELYKQQPKVLYFRSVIQASDSRVHVGHRLNVVVVTLPIIYFIQFHTISLPQLTLTTNSCFVGLQQ